MKELRHLDEQRWVTRILLALLIVCALMWGLTADMLKTSRKRLERLDKQVKMLKDKQS